MFHFIGFIITGFVVGLLARALKPGDDQMGLGSTTLLGILGALGAGYFGRLVGWYAQFESAGFIASTIGAVLLLALYYAVKGRRLLPH